MTCSNKNTTQHERPVPSSSIHYRTLMTYSWGSYFLLNIYDKHVLLVFLKPFDYDRPVWKHWTVEHWWLSTKNTLSEMSSNSMMWNLQKGLTSFNTKTCGHYPVCMGKPCPNTKVHLEKNSACYNSPFCLLGTDTFSPLLDIINQTKLQGCLHMKHMNEKYSYSWCSNCYNHLCWASPN